MKMKAIIILFISLFIGLQMPTAKGQKLPTRTIVVNGVSFNMIHVEGGTFMMGSTDEQESGAEEDEFPAHSVTLRNYYIGETEVTQALWVAVMENNPSFFEGDSHPVVMRCRPIVDSTLRNRGLLSLVATSSLYGVIEILPLRSCQTISHRLK